MKIKLIDIGILLLILILIFFLEVGYSNDFKEFLLVFFTSTIVLIVFCCFYYYIQKRKVDVAYLERVLYEGLNKKGFYLKDSYLEGERENYLCIYFSGTEWFFPTYSIEVFFSNNNDEVTRGLRWKYLHSNYFWKKNSIKILVQFLFIPPSYTKIESALDKLTRVLKEEKLI